jgi:hypothetical protein
LSSHTVFPFTDGLKSKRDEDASFPTEEESTISFDKLIRIVEPELMVPAVKAEMYSPKAGSMDAVRSFALFPVLK